MRRFRPLPFVRTVLLGFALAGAPGAALAEADPSADPSTAPMPSLEPVDPVVVELLDPGAEPRVELRFRYTAGEALTMQMRMVQSLTTVVGASRTTVDLPPIEYRLEGVIREVDEAGVATVDMVLVSVEAIDLGGEDGTGGALVEQLNAALAPLAGLRTVTRVDPRGITIEAATNLEAIDPALAQQVGDLMGIVNQMAAPLPEEPVGMGARWITRGMGTTNGLTLETEQTSELEYLEDPVVRLRLTGVQAGVPGPADLPGLPAGVTAELVTLDGTLEGRAGLDLDRLVPRSQVEGSVRAVVAVSDGTTEQEVESIAETEVMVRPIED